MKLTLTREQIPLARETVAFLRSVNGGPAADQPFERRRCCPGWDWWTSNDADADGGDWADALEAAITEAGGGKGAEPGPVSDADERAFWREVFLRTYDGTPEPGHSAACADEALARYRKAFGGES